MKNRAPRYKRFSPKENSLSDVLFLFYLPNGRLSTKKLTPDPVQSLPGTKNLCGTKKLCGTTKGLAASNLIAREAGWVSPCPSVGLKSLARTDCGATTC
jgi:hypothetical protein